MKKGLLQEIKAMNKIAGTQLTKEQEVAIIRERLQQLNELEFGTQKSFDAYKKDHDMRPDTKVTVAGNKTTVAQASKNSAGAKPKGKSVFGGTKKVNDKSITDIKKDKEVDASTVSKSLLANLRVNGDFGYVDKVAKELETRLNKGDEGVYKRTSPQGGSITFKDGASFDVFGHHDAKKTGNQTIYASKNSPDANDNTKMSDADMKQYNQYVKNYQKALKKQGEFPK